MLSLPPGSSMLSLATGSSLLITVCGEKLNAVIAAPEALWLCCIQEASRCHWKPGSSMLVTGKARSCQRCAGSSMLSLQRMLTPEAMMTVGGLQRLVMSRAGCPESCKQVRRSAGSCRFNFQWR